MGASGPAVSTGKAQQGKDANIYEQVFDAILEQRLIPGTRLSEDKLGQLFGVSRTIVRTVLQRLAFEGVVEIQRHQGAIIARTTAEQARQVFAARKAVELEVVRNACRHISAVQLEHLHALVWEEQEARGQQDHGRALRLSGELHLYLAEYCGNEFLAGFLRSLVSRCSLIIAQYEAADRHSCPPTEHGAILEAIGAGDEALAVKLMAAHIDHIEAKIDVREKTAPPDLSAIFSKTNKEN